MSGAPPINHPDRCQAKRRKGPCFRWSLKGSKYCQFHGGRSANNRFKSLKVMPSFYGQKLGPTLTVYLEQSLAIDPSEQLSLLQEVALLRHRASSTVALYSAAIEKKVNPEAIASAADMMAAALTDVANMSKTAAAIRAANDDKIDAGDLNVFVQQILRIISHHLHDYPDIAKDIEADMRNEIRMPVTKGTAPTPSEVSLDVASMDDQFE